MKEQQALAKRQYMDQLIAYTQEYKKILLFNADNVGSHHIQKVRQLLRGKAIMLMGKNTLIRKALKDKASENVKKLLPFIKGNIGFVFTNEDEGEIRSCIEEMKIPATAKPGQISPVKVILPAGLTGLEPTKSSFFHALGITDTKVTRMQIEVLKPYVVLEVGQKVGSSEATLLQMMNITPFAYGLKTEYVYLNGDVIKASVLDITEDQMRQKFYNAASKIASIGLATGIPNRCSVPHSIVANFKNLLALACSTKIKFPQAEQVQGYLEDPSKFQVTEVKEEKKEEETQQEEEEEEESSEGGMDGLFGGSDSD